MDKTHDPFQQTVLIQQALAPAKMPIGLFLGAGCPLSIRVPRESGGDLPLIPDVAGVTDAVCEKLAKSDGFRGSLVAIKEHLKADGKGPGNIEDILSHVRALRQAAGRQEARGLSADQLSKLDDEICTLIVNCVRKRLPSRNTPYHQVASWVEAIAREHPLEVFTPNYDLLMEQAFEEIGVPYFDGFVGSDRTFFDPPSMEPAELPLRWARLWKLHGSINWREDEEGRISRGEKFDGYKRRLIHPSYFKFEESRQMPFLAMIDRLRAFLSQSPAVLVVCGYSFSDDHLNRVLRQGLQGNASAMCFALLHSTRAKRQNAVALAARRANLSLLARDGAVVGTRSGSWAVPADSETDRLPIAVHVEKKNEEDDGVCEFRLGDFARFAEFLADQIGANRAGEAPGDAR